MLNKLLKYEFKSTARIFCPIYGLLLAFALLSHLSVSGLMEMQESFLNTLSVIAIMGYVVVIISTMVITFVVIVQRFFKNLTGDEGYLMHTLPVSSHQLITAKLISSVVWEITSALMVMLSVFLLFMRPEVLRQIPQFLGDVGQILVAAVGEVGLLRVVGIVLSAIVFMLLSAATATLLIFASISIGHIISTHRVMGSFAAYIGLMMVMQAVTALLGGSGIAVAETYFDGVPILAPQAASMVLGILWVSILLQACFAGALYFITQYVLSHRLNLE